MSLPRRGASLVDLEPVSSATVYCSTLLGFAHGQAVAGGPKDLLWDPGAAFGAARRPEGNGNSPLVGSRPTRMPVAVVTALQPRVGDGWIVDLPEPAEPWGRNIWISGHRDYRDAGLDLWTLDYDCSGGIASRLIKTSFITLPSPLAMPSLPPRCARFPFVFKPVITAQWGSKRVILQTKGMPFATGQGNHKYGHPMIDRKERKETDFPSTSCAT